MKERFLEDTKNHTMTVFQDDGKYRHLKFSNNGSQIYRFDLVTWPGYLALTGDMGEYIWSRIPDMFEFFRQRDLEINPSYWTEKLRAGEAKEDSGDAVLEQIKQYHKDWEFDTDELRDLVWQEIEDDLLPYIDEGAARAYDALTDFESMSDPGFKFRDVFEWSYREYTHQYIWCLYAIVWGIQQYDKTCSK